MSTRSKKSDESWDYFCDCPICQAMKNGTADTLEGLRAAFKEAEEKQKREGLEKRST
jgi:hypothetical protein